LIVQLDFVVTVDTSVAHLTGSLGVPAFVLLPLASDWRWGLGETTAWYPSLQLVRQRALGDWSSAVDQLSVRLGDLASRPRTAAA
jgi:ADP-heptose:LPS heptosyltransferase